MSDTITHRLQITGPSMDAICDVLGLPKDLPVQGEYDLSASIGAAAHLTCIRNSKSSGFNATQFVLEGVMTLVTSTASSVLAAWLLERLKRQPDLKVRVDGKQLQRAKEEGPA